MTRIITPWIKSPIGLSEFAWSRLDVNKYPLKKGSIIYNSIVSVWKNYRQPFRWFCFDDNLSKQKDQPWLNLHFQTSELARDSANLWLQSLHCRFIKEAAFNLLAP